MEAYAGHPFSGTFVVRDGYKAYYTNVKMYVGVGLNPPGTRFMEAIVNEHDKSVTFVNYYDDDIEEWHTLKLRDINPPILWRSYPDFDYPF